MAGSDQIYNIPFVGLKIGTHTFEYEVNDKFFEDISYSLVHSGKLQVKLQLDKRETMLIAHFEVVGVVTADCDRCNTPMNLALSGSMKLIYKFGLEEEEDDSMVVLHPDEYQINVKDPIYELITLSLPSRKKHPTGECDEEMWALIQKYTINPEEEEDDEDDFDEDYDDDEDGDDDDDPDTTDPRWSLLKNLN